MLAKLQRGRAQSVDALSAERSSIDAKRGKTCPPPANAERATKQRARSLAIRLIHHLVRCGLARSVRCRRPLAPTALRPCFAFQRCWQQQASTEHRRRSCSAAYSLECAAIADAEAVRWVNRLLCVGLSGDAE